MKKLKAVFLGLVTAAGITGRAFADAIAPPDSELSMRMSGFLSDPLVIVIIAAVVIIAVLIIVGTIRTARKPGKRKSDGQEPHDRKE